MLDRPSGPDRVLAPIGLIKLGLIKLGATDLAGILHQVVHFAGLSIQAATDVSITIIGGHGPYTPAFTGEMALELDEKQYELQDGPCLQSATEQITVLIRDTAHDTRWHDWPALAAASGAGSVLSVAMPILDDVAGALNVYGRAADAFGPDAIAAAQAFAEHAAVTLANAHLYDRTAGLAHQMQSAMEYRAVIEQAKGIVMGERRCTPEEAFAVLAKISQHSNRKLRDIAAAIVARSHSGSEPPPPVTKSVPNGG